MAAGGDVGRKSAADAGTGRRVRAPDRGDRERRPALSPGGDAGPGRAELRARHEHRHGTRHPAGPQPARRQPGPALAGLLPQPAGPGHHRPRLYLDRPHRGRGHHGGGAEQDPQRRWSPSAKAAVPSIPACSTWRAVFEHPARPPPAPRHPAPALPLSAGRRPLRPRPDLEDRARGRAARPLEWGRLPARASTSSSSTSPRSWPTASPSSPSSR